MAERILPISPEIPKTRSIQDLTDELVLRTRHELGILDDTRQICETDLEIYDTDILVETLKDKINKETKIQILQSAANSIYDLFMLIQECSSPIEVKLTTLGNLGVLQYQIYQRNHDLSIRHASLSDSSAIY